MGRGGGVAWVLELGYGSKKDVIFIVLQSFGTLSGVQQNLNEEL